MVDIEYVATTMARAMIKQHPSFADPDLFKNSLGWYQFSEGRKLTPQQKERFLTKYRSTYERLTRESET